MSDAKKILKSTIVYFFGNVGTRLISFLLLPLYTNKINPNDYGLYDVSCTYAILISSILFLDIWTGIMKFYYEKKDNEKNSVIYSGLMIFLMSTVAYAVVFILFSFYKGIDYWYFVGLYGFSMCIENLYGYLARAYGHNSLYALTGIISATINAMLNILLILVFKLDYSSLYISYIAGVTIQVIIIEKKIHLIPNFKLEYFDKATFMKILRFSLPLCINSLCYWLLTGYNKIIINQNLTAEANGYYAIAAKFAAVISIVSSCFSMAWQEISYQKYEKNSTNSKFFTYTTNMYLKFLVSGYMVLISMIYFIFPIIIGNDYAPAKELIPIYLLATIASIISNFLGSIITTLKRNDVIFLSTLTASIVNIAIVYIFIKNLGVQAANLGLLCGYIASVIIRCLIISKEIDFKINIKNFIIIIPLLIITILTFSKGNYLLNLLSAVMGIVAFIAFFRIELKQLIFKIKEKR